MFWPHKQSKFSKDINIWSENVNCSIWMITYQYDFCKWINFVLFLFEYENKRLGKFVAALLQKLLNSLSIDYGLK